MPIHPDLRRSRPEETKSVLADPELPEPRYLEIIGLIFVVNFVAMVLWLGH
jgi:hypothetical protein